MSKSTKEHTDSYTISSKMSSRGEKNSRKISKVEWAYAAGLFDGEGCVTVLNIKRYRKDTYKRPLADYPHWALRVVITSTSMELLNFMQERFLGSIHLHTHVDIKGRKRQFQWYLGSKVDCTNFLKGVLPFLLYKKPEAELALEFFSGVGNRSAILAPEEVIRRQNIVDQIRSLPGRKKGLYNEGPKDWTEKGSL